MVYILLCCLCKWIDFCCVNGGVFFGLNKIVVKSYGLVDLIGVVVVLVLVYCLVEFGFLDKFVVWVVFVVVFV